jgi:multiple sugar transport system permease protein
VASVSVKKRPLTLARREAIWAYALISPWILGFIVFTLGPMVASIYFSLTNLTVTTLTRAPKFAGLLNWIKMLTDDPKFWWSFRVTVTYAAAAIPLGLALGLALALLLNAKVPGLRVWRTIFYMPSVLSTVAVAVLWTFIFNPSFGVLNWLLRVTSLWRHPPGWLGSTTWALPALILMSLWGVGGGMIIYLAGLQGIPTTLYEAATIDGAGAAQRFWSITLPMISPVIFYNLITGIIGTFQYFANAFIMTNGGPADATLFYNLYLYRQTFTFGDLAFGSAMAWFLLFVVLVLSLLVFRSSSMWVYYEGELRGR